jgi:hypothetical protein
MRWGFAAEDVVAYLPGGDEVEWGVPTDESTEEIVPAIPRRGRALKPLTS